jgi:hypothetical protein
MDTPLVERVYIHNDHITYSTFYAIDAEKDTIIALQMLGAEQSVKAAWAHLVTNGKQSAYINKHSVTLDGSKKHVQFKGSLPENGRFESWLIHKQAIPGTANPGIEPFFYLLALNPDDSFDAENVETPFINMLDRLVNAPLLPEWAPALWERGVDKRLISLIPQSDCRNMLVYKIKINAAMWQTIVSQELRRSAITF